MLFSAKVAIVITFPTNVASGGVPLNILRLGVMARIQWHYGWFNAYSEAPLYNQIDMFVFFSNVFICLRDIKAGSFSIDHTVGWWVNLIFIKNWGSSGRCLLSSSQDIIIDLDLFEKIS